MRAPVKPERAGRAIRPGYYISLRRYASEGVTRILHLGKKKFFVVGPSPAEIMPRYGKWVNSLGAVLLN